MARKKNQQMAEPFLRQIDQKTDRITVRTQKVQLDWSENALLQILDDLTSHPMQTAKRLKLTSALPF